MEDLVHELVYATFVAQMYLFALPVIGAIWFIGKEMFGAPALKPKKSINNDDKGSQHETEVELEPLNCPACGAGVPLNETEMHCPRCATAFPVPPEYEEIRLAREQSLKAILRAQRYWRIASLMTARSTLAIVVFLTLWLIACLILIMTWVGTPLIEPFDALLDRFQIPALTLLFWIATLGFVAISISLKFRRSLPVIKRAEAAKDAEVANCENCGGAMSFASGQFGSLCGYCGVDTYRVSVAKRVAKNESRSADDASIKLQDEMEHYTTAVEEFLALPTLIIIGVIMLIVVYFAVTLGLMVILSAIVLAIMLLLYGFQNYPILTAICVILIITALIFRKRVTKFLRSSFLRKKSR